MCVEVIVFSALALYLGTLLYFQIQREKIIMKQINPTHANSRSTHERDLISRADAIEAVASADETNGTVKVFSGFEVIDILKALPSAKAVQRGW